MNPIDALFRVDVRRGADAISAPRISLAIDDRESDRWIESRAVRLAFPLPPSLSLSLSRSRDRDSFAEHIVI